MFRVIRRKTVEGYRFDLGSIYIDKDGNVIYINCDVGHLAAEGNNTESVAALSEMVDELKEALLLPPIDFMKFCEEIAALNGPYPIEYFEVE